MLVVALIMLGACFLCGLVLAARGGLPLRPEGDLATRAIDLVGRPLAAGELSAESPGCLQGERLVVGAGATCRYRIEPSGGLLVTLTLQLQQGTLATIALSQPDVVTSRKQLGPGQSVELDVFQGGATLDVGCAGLAGCLLIRR
jgi:hypothetical protein